MSSSALLDEGNILVDDLVNLITTQYSNDDFAVISSGPSGRQLAEKTRGEIDPSLLIMARQLILQATEKQQAGVPFSRITIILIKNASYLEGVITIVGIYVNSQIKAALEAYFRTRNRNLVFN